MATKEETETARRVEQLLEKPIEQAGYQLLEVQYRHEGRWVLRLIVDREPGISMDDLAVVNELAGRLLEVDDPIPQAFSLEVSSPGLFRALLEIKHYRQSTGKWAKLTLAPETEAPDLLVGGKKRQIRGIIRNTDEDSVQLEADGAQVSIKIGDIRAARLDPDL